MSGRYRIAVSSYCNAVIVKCCDTAKSQRHTVAISSNRSMVTSRHRSIHQSPIGQPMKKTPNASDLAARLLAAAKQPAGMSSVPAPAVADPEPPSKAPVAASATAPSKPKKPKTKEPQTVPITLRPDSNLWNKFVIKASERTREEGRVVSAQQIMLEALERSDA